MKNKRGAEMSMIGYLLIAAATLLLGLAIYLVLSGKLAGIIEYIKNLISFRGD